MSGELCKGCGRPAAVTSISSGERELRSPEDVDWALRGAARRLVDERGDKDRCVYLRLGGFGSAHGLAEAGICARRPPLCRTPGCEAMVLVPRNGDNTKMGRCLDGHDSAFG